MVALALAGGIIGYLYMKHRSRQQRIELVHRERMAAMEKGIPLPEFPSEPERGRRPPDPDILPIMGTVFLSLSVGAMIVLYRMLPAPSHSVWVSPLPLAFLGAGLIAFHFLKGEPGR
jgi:hypothetical protein